MSLFDLLDEASAGLEPKVKAGGAPAAAGVEAGDEGSKTADRGRGRKKATSARVKKKAKIKGVVSGVPTPKKEVECETEDKKEIEPEAKDREGTASAPKKVGETEASVEGETGAGREAEAEAKAKEHKRDDKGRVILDWYSFVKQDGEGRVIAILNDKGEELSEENYEEFIGHPPKNEDSRAIPEANSARAKRERRGMYSKRFRVLKKWVRAIEKYNYQYIVAIRLDDNFWGIFGHSSVIFTYKLCLNGPYQPNHAPDKDHFTKIPDGRVYVRAVDKMYATIRDSYYYERMVVETEDVLVFKLKDKVSSRQYEELLEREDTVKRALEAIAADVDPMPSLKMKLLEAHTMAFNFCNKYTYKVSRANVAERIEQLLARALEEQHLASRKLKDKKEVLNIIELLVVRADAVLVLNAEVEAWPRVAIMDMGFILSDCMKEVVTERRKMEGKKASEDEMEDKIRAGALQK